MKMVKIIFLIMLALIIFVFLGIFIFIKTLDVNKYLPQITQQAGLAINRKIDIGHANLNLGLKGFSLELKNIIISDDPKFSQNNFLTVDTAYVGIDLMELITKRAIDITKISITNPKISVIRLADGNLNVQTMVPAASSSVVTNTSSTSQVQTSQAMALPALLIKSILINHVQISYEDRNAQMPMQISVPDGEIKIDNFSLNEPFNFTIDLNLLSQGKKNINISGQVILDLATTAVKINHLQIKSDLSQFDLQKIKSTTPMLQNMPIWPEKIQGDLSFDVPELNASSKGLQSLNLKISLNNGSVKLKELLNVVDHISLQADTDLNNLTVKQLQLHVGAGEIDVQSTLHEILTSPTYDFHFQSKSIKVEDLFDQSKAPAQLKGEVTADFSGMGQGFEPQAFLSNFKTEGNLSLNNATIEKLNILKTILEKLDFIPGLGSILQNVIQTSMPTNINSELNSDTTQLTKAEAKIKVENKIINLEDAQLESNLFSIGAQGKVDFDLNTNIDVKTYLASDFSAVLTKKVKPLQSLLDDQNRLYLPGTVSGKAPNSIGYHLQIDYVTKKVAVFEGSQQLQNVLGKNTQVGNILNAVLGGGSQSQNTTQSTSNDTQTQDNSSNNLLNGVLNNIFK